MVRVVQVMLLRFGVISSIKGSRLYIYGECAKTFGERIGFVSKWKRSRLSARTGKQTRYVIPISREEARLIPITDETRFVRQNAMLRGTISRESVKKLDAAGLRGIGECLGWHWVKVQRVTPVAAPTMCLEVPGEGRFLQNGFPHFNSQGSEWPIVIAVIDDHNAARMVQTSNWIYTGISRAKEFCVTLGQRRVIQEMLRRDGMNRKTFLKELIETHVQEMQIEDGIDHAVTRDWLGFPIDDLLDGVLGDVGGLLDGVELTGVSNERCPF